MSTHANCAASAVIMNNKEAWLPEAEGLPDADQSRDEQEGCAGQCWSSQGSFDFFLLCWHGLLMMVRGRRAWDWLW